MPAPHDLDPPSMNEEERLAKRRYQAYHAFESEYPPVERSRVTEFNYGTVEQAQRESKVTYLNKYHQFTMGGAGPRRGLTVRGDAEGNVVGQNIGGPAGRYRRAK